MKNSQIQYMMSKPTWPYKQVFIFKGLYCLILYLLYVKMVKSVTPTEDVQTVNITHTVSLTIRN